MFTCSKVVGQMSSSYCSSFYFFIVCSQTLATGIEQNGMLLSYKFSGLLADFGSFYEAF